MRIKFLSLFALLGFILSASVALADGPLVFSPDGCVYHARSTPKYYTSSQDGFKANIQLYTDEGKYYGTFNNQAQIVGRFSSCNPNSLQEQFQLVIKDYGVYDGMEFFISCNLDSTDTAICLKQSYINMQPPYSSMYVLYNRSVITASDRFSIQAKYSGKKVTFLTLSIWRYVIS